jgi:hypothetical protein
MNISRQLLDVSLYRMLVDMKCQYSVPKIPKERIQSTMQFQLAVPYNSIQVS